MQEGDIQIAPQRQKKSKTSGFAQYSFVYELFKAIMVNGLKMPTPVQRKTIPVIMSGKDAIVCYKTGSGKTLSYLLPMINKLKCHSTIVGARGLVIVPTKDLAEQISKVLLAYKKYTDLQYVLLLGGHTYDGQFDRLASNPDIIIATPGRLMQLVVDTDLRLGRIEMIVFDEADQLFQNGKFTMQLKQILQKCPVSQRLMFSATINENLNDFAKTCLRQYSYIHQQVALPENMNLDAYILRPGQKIAALLYIIQKIIEQQKAIIFASTRFHVDYLVSLIGSVRQCYGIYGKMDVEQRTYSLDNFRKKKKSVILIVTDVAARGLDIPYINYVIHYDYPTNHKTFVHRSGRTARKNQSGNTIALISNNQIPYLIQLAQYVGRKLTLHSQTKQAINYGTIPNDITDSYVNIVKNLKQKNDQIQKNESLSNKAFEKFKKCRTQASQSGMKRAKTIQIQTHYKFRNSIQPQEQSFLYRIKNYAPKQSFLQLQKSQFMKQNENDPFLNAVEKIKNQQEQRKLQEMKKQKLRKSNSQKWKNILSKQQTKFLQDYKDQRDRQRIPIKQVNGIQIQMMNKKQKKSQKKDFRNHSQYISSVKNPNYKTQFDELPKIKNNELDQLFGDENPVKKKKQRKWDKIKKNYVWSKDKEDKISKDAKGKVAYTKWKKKNRLSLPKLGQNQDTENTRMAKQKWKQTRKFRHGWKQNKQKNRSLKNNKTKAIEKKYKTRLISKSMTSKGKRNKR